MDPVTPAGLRFPADMPKAFTAVESGWRQDSTGGYLNISAHLTDPGSLKISYLISLRCLAGAWTFGVSKFIDHKIQREHLHQVGLDEVTVLIAKHGILPEFRWVCGFAAQTAGIPIPGHPVKTPASMSAFAQAMARKVKRDAEKASDPCDFIVPDF
ncbi:hypothetical protein UFOVP1382_23 [uncultured Caudovirales phage]|uniref:Uncharacterized protein n=1 Tax=uncultured Caudovirales phage TaxID=2100421 RepID=A0A6J5S3Q4_9CAUD|nr:hypothetical protein UFOVP1382_23 [uncultured Caudovirales phage]